MVWGGIMTDEHTNLHVFDRGTLTGQGDEILAPYGRHFREAYEPNFIFLDDNIHRHRVQLVKKYLQLEDIQRLE
ncbi:hypothetical protein TNCV_2711721 [Trichonephila clavipes]|nr:hypothetical protein TNCV_2711721 [Trichonephila clavipes]